MRLEAIKCPKCDARLNLVEAAKFCACDHCGNNFVVHWPQPAQPELTPFQAILERLVTQQDFLVADRRLGYLAQDISESQAEMRQASAAFVATQGDITAVKAKYNEKIRNALVCTGLLTVFSLVMLMVFFASLGDSGAGWGLLLAVGAALGAWYCYQLWKKTMAGEPAELRDAEERADLARERCIAAQAQLKELELEQVLCEGKTRRFRYHGDKS